MSQPPSIVCAVQWRSLVVEVMSNIDEVLAARNREVSATPAHEFE